MTERQTLLQDLARSLEHLGPGRHLAAIDGVDGSGKTRFAQDLARAVCDRPVIVIHLDDFLNTDDVRHRLGRSAPEGFWLDTYDYAALRQCVLEPLATEGDGLYLPAPPHRLHARGDSDVFCMAPRDALVIVEGMFLHRDGMPAWHHSVFLDVPFTVTSGRMAVRDGTHPDPDHPSMHRYVGGQRLYFAAVRPWLRADLVVDHADPLAPRVISRAEAALRKR